MTKPSESTGPQTPLPGAQRALLLLLAINMFNYLDRQVLAAVEPEIRKDILVTQAPPGSSMTSIAVDNASFWSGLLSFAFLYTYMFIAPLFGILADRWRRWAIVGIGVIVWSLASGASGLNWTLLLGVNLAAAYWLLFASRCFVGVGEGAYGPVAPTMLADLFPVQRRGQIMAWFYLAIPVGGALGYTLGDVVRHMGEDGWRWAFYLVVIPGLLLGLVAFFMPEPPRGQAESVVSNTKRPINWRDYWDLIKIPSYVFNTLGMTCMTFAIGGLAWWMAQFLEDHNAGPFLGIPPRAFFGILVAVAGLLATLAGGWAGDAMRKYHSGSYFLVSGISMILGFPMVLLAIWVPFPAAWLFIFLAVFSLFFNTAPTNAILANVTHPAVRATGFAVNILVIHLFGDAISPAIIGGIRDGIDLDSGFILVSVLMLIGGVLWIWGAQYLQRDTELAPTRLREVEQEH